MKIALLSLSLLLEAVHQGVVEGKGCFRGDMRVSMADGSLKRIDHVQSGDVVISWDEQASAWGNATVKELVTFQRAEMARITIGVDGLAFSRDVIATVDHPFYSLRTKSIVSLDPQATKDHYLLDAERMADREIFQDMFGQPVHGAVELLPQLSNPIPTFTLCLEPTHWFFVEGVRVHNKGCFVPDTHVLMADGSTKEIGKVSAGDQVRSWDETGQRQVNATVGGLVTFRRKELMKLELESGDRILATPDHPFWSVRANGIVSLAPHSTRTEYELEASMLADDGETFHDASDSNVRGIVSDVILLDQDTTVMTLCLQEPHWFFVGERNSFVRVHNKGCFRGDTPVTLEDGTEREIMHIKEGEYVMSWDGSSLARAKVLSVVEFQRQEFVQLEVDVQGMSKQIFATPEHPFWSPLAQTEMSFDPEATKSLYGLSDVIQMKEEDSLLDINGQLTSVKKKRSFTMSNQEPVFTLMLEDRHYFFAQSVLVHNKGGGKGGSFGGSKGGGSKGGGSIGGSSGGSKNYFKTSSGARYGYDSDRGSYFAAGYYFGAMMYPRPTYYAYSATCQSDPTSPGCPESSNDDIVCGCPENSQPGIEDFQEWSKGSKASTKNEWGFEYCSKDTKEGICVTAETAKSKQCFPTRFADGKLSSRDRAFDMVNSIAKTKCSNEYESCLEEEQCKQALNDQAFQGSLYRNATLVRNYDSRTVEKLATCMSKNVKLCECTWEVCTEQERWPGFVATVTTLSVVLGPCVLLCLCYGLLAACHRLRAGCESCLDRCNRASERRRRKQRDRQANKFRNNKTPKAREIDAAPVRAPQVHGSVPQVHGSVEFCFRNHALVKTNTNTVARETGDSSYRDGFYCDRCEAGFPKNSTLFRCADCEVDFCSACNRLRDPIPVLHTANEEYASNFTDKDVIVVTDQVPQTNAHRCLSEHHQTKRVTAREIARTDPEYRAGVICDNCKGFFSPDTVFNKCVTCDFDFCDGCLDPFRSSSVNMV